MSTWHASACGALAGLLLGIAIMFALDMQAAVAGYRLAVLIIGGAWMGSILAEINRMLQPQAHARRHDHEGHRS